MLQTLGFASFLAAQVVATAPNPSTLGTSATILMENDLYGAFSNKTSSAILLEQPKTFASAKSICSSFSETLWSPETQDFTAGVNNSLSYQAYLRKFSYSQQFWVADEVPANGCKAIDLSGKVRELDCGRLLPALCSHSAPISNETFWDLSEKYQVAVTAGENSITGFRDAFGFRFMGIRYAQNPGRFEHSTVYDVESDVTALKYGPWCIQMRNGAPYGDEDCFVLNIGTPYLPAPGAPAQNLKPVFFWIHGGGFVENSGDLGNTDGITVASRGDFVVVKLNYRLGHFGWLALNGTSITGNYGLGDMITALKWVHKYIEGFGGDANRITIGGDSSGASAVRALMTSEAAEGLFSGAISHSIPIGWMPNAPFAHYMTIPEYTAVFGPAVIQQSGCSSASDIETCLTDVSPITLNAAVASIGRYFSPT
ncbi:Neuroligin-2 [Dactylellina cionopaga]|nr:Neuroligin-2 [Dactylellina cionopaga]